MKASVHLLNVDDMRCRLTVDMTVGELRRLKEQLGKAPGWTAWPLAGLREIATATVEKAEEEFSKEIDGR